MSNEESLKLGKKIRLLLLPFYIVIGLMACSLFLIDDIISFLNKKFGILSWIRKKDKDY